MATVKETENTLKIPYPDFFQLAEWCSRQMEICRITYHKDEKTRAALTADSVSYAFKKSLHPFGWQPHFPRQNTLYLFIEPIQRRSYLWAEFSAAGSNCRLVSTCQAVTLERFCFWSLKLNRGPAIDQPRPSFMINIYWLNVGEWCVPFLLLHF